MSPADIVTVLADSVLLGAEDTLVDELGAAGYTVDFRGRPALMLHQSNDQLAAANSRVGETVVIGLGHNTLWERDRARFDTWAEKFDSEADELLATLRRLGAKRFVWVTLREPSEDVIPPEGRRAVTSSTCGTSRTSTSVSTPSPPAIPTSSSPTGRPCPTRPG